MLLWMMALTTFPLAFPGVVVGFMVIMLAGRQGLIGDVAVRLTGQKLVFAYSMAGLFTGYLYFSIPRVILTIMAAAEKLDRRLEEAARSLGRGPWRGWFDVALPLARPAIAAGTALLATVAGALAAYAVSRRRTAGSRAILLVLLATLAFPLPLLMISIYQVFAAA